jgi:hypothetical protein
MYNGKWVVEFETVTRYQKKKNRFLRNKQDISKAHVMDL